MRTRWHDLEGRGRVQTRLKLPLCLTDLETARFAIAWLHRPHTTNASSARNTKNCPPRWESPPCPTWNFANGISPFWEHRPQESFKQVFSVHRILLLLFSLFSMFRSVLLVQTNDAMLGRVSVDFLTFTYFEVSFVPRLLHRSRIYWSEVGETRRYLAYSGFVSFLELIYFQVAFVWEFLDCDWRQWSEIERSLMPGRSVFSYWCSRKINVRFHGVTK